jgi:hypothetical protein
MGRRALARSPHLAMGTRSDSHEARAIAARGERREGAAGLLKESDHESASRHNEAPLMTNRGRERKTPLGDPADPLAEDLTPPTRTSKCDPRLLRV